jgi:predicted nucleic acid-binding protein
VAVEQRLADLARLVDAACTRRTSTAGQDFADQCAGLVAVLDADYPKQTKRHRKGEPDTVAELQTIFGLDDAEALLLVAAAAPDVDATFAGAYALVHGEPSRTRLSVRLGLELAGIGTMSARGHACLAPGGTLRRTHLLDVLGDDVFLHRPLQVPDRVVAALVGDNTPEPSVVSVAVDVVPVGLPETTTLAAALRAGEPLAWVRSRPGTAGTAIAAGAFGALGVGSLCIDLRRAAPATSLDSLIADACREAALQQAGLVVAGVDRLVTEGRISLLRELEVAAVPVVAVANLGWDPAWSHRAPAQVEAPVLPIGERAKLWTRELGEAAASDPHWPDLVSLRLTPEAITKTARHARAARAQADDDAGDLLGVTAARESARSLGSDAVQGATRVRPTATFDDLIVPDPVGSALRRIVSWGRLHDEVMAPGTRFSTGGKGRGITALFAGSPGTGKTLAAHAVAGELGLDLFRVDLAAVVDKYIGETEKNLERVFHEAEALNVVLFFDEADSLFGSRSEVRDSRDRYANLEVAYLLQRMEQFDGIAILATNLRGNLDTAFSRRLHFLVHFADPDASIRAQLWRHHLDAVGAPDPKDPVQIEELASSVELSGGDIRNVVLAAAFDAAAAGEAIGQRHINAAVARELGKLGRRVPNAAAEALAIAALAKQR